MTVEEAIKNRRSIREFKDKKIPEAYLEKLKQALIWAPSAGNLQSRQFIFVFNQEIRNKLAEVSGGQKFISEAPLVIVACANLEQSASKYGERGRDLYCLIDTALSVENLFLQAEELGLGGVWVGRFDESSVIEVLNLPKNLKPIGLIPIGFPKIKPKPTPRVSEDQAIKIIN